MRVALFFILGLLLVTDAAAQGGKLTATVSKNVVSTREGFQYTLTLANTEGEIILPQLSDFQVMQGPSISQSTQIINGKVTREYSHTYVLRATKEGTLIIPAASARTSSGMLKSDKITIKSYQDRAPQQNSQNADLFTTVELSKKKAYIGEPIIATYKVYTRFRELSAEELNIPQPEGFWSEELETPQTWMDEVINGRRLQSYILKQEILFPQTSGDLDIGEFSIVALCRNSFFQRPTRLSAASPSQKVKVLPLPDGKGPDHIGTYSNLKIETKVDRDELASNEAFNIEVKITGLGNLKLLPEPTIPFPSDFEVFDPKIKDNISITKNGESGSRTFDYVVIPRSAGEYRIPAVTSSYFDYRKKEHRTLRSSDLNITVAQGSGESSGSYTFDSKSDVNILNQDIRFIKTGNVNLSPRSSRFFGSIFFYGLISLPWLALVSVVFWKRRQEQADADVVGTKRRKAARMAKKHLAQARQVQDTGQTKEFYEELFKALYGYLSNKLSIQPSDLSREMIEEKLKAITEESTIIELFEVLDICEQARFAPVSNVSESQAMERSNDIILIIERSI